jgi:pimeloyl-ACP methyl ester carboxylesterase
VHEDVAFYSDGHRLAADLYLPEGVAPGERRPAIVLCHGFGGVRRFLLPEFGRFFADAGFVVLAFDHRGFGDSEGPKWRLLPLEQVADIRNALTFLETRDEVDPARLALYGTSFGGGNAVYAAAIDQRVQAMVATVGFGDGERWLRSLRRHWEWLDFLDRLAADRTQRVLTGRSDYVDTGDIMVRDPEALEHEQKRRADFPEQIVQLPLETASAILEFKPEAIVHQIAPRPALFIAVERDLLVPTEETLRLHELAGEPKALHVMPAIGHHGVYYGDHLTEVLGTASEWFARHLGGVAT